MYRIASYHESFVPLLDLLFREARFLQQCAQFLFAQFWLTVAHRGVSTAGEPDSRDTVGSIQRFVNSTVDTKTFVNTI